MELPGIICNTSVSVRLPLHRPVLLLWQSLHRKKKISDYLTDRKFSLFQKENQYVVCSAGQIVWLVGERSDDRFRVTEDTKRVLIIRQLEDK